MSSVLLLDNAAAMLVSKVAFTEWTTPHALSLTINPTVAAQMIGLEAGFSE